MTRIGQRKGRKREGQKVSSSTIWRMRRCSYQRKLLGGNPLMYMFDKGVNTFPGTEGSFRFSSGWCLW